MTDTGDMIPGVLWIGKILFLQTGNENKKQ
jgi:hypothetical protein